MKIKGFDSNYKVGEVDTSDKGFTTIQIYGPKKTFTLCNCVKPLKKISPPLHDGENARVQEFPLFFVLNGKAIHGAAFFALDGDTLIPYKSVGRCCMEEL
jgi:hypothetical protein